VKRVLLLSAIFLLSVATPPLVTGQIVGPSDYVKQAVKAIGGPDALHNLRRLTITGEAKHWEPGQSFVAGGDPRLLDDSKLTITWDLERKIVRTNWDRDMYYPFPGAKSYSEIVTPTGGIVVSGEPGRPMSNIRLAAHLRELERASPTLALEILDAPERLQQLPDQLLDGKKLPAVMFTSGTTNFTILFDRMTHLPAAIRTLDDDSVYGDSSYDLLFADWKPISGVQFAHSLTYKLNGSEIGWIKYTQVIVNPEIPAHSFEIPDEMRNQTEPPASGLVPYQWVIRRLNLGLFTDSDAINYDSATSKGLRLAELAPNVQHVVGGTHNGLIVAMKNYLVVFDAPINEWQSRWTIEAAKARYPGKPIKYLVLTHHHNDHIGGCRTYVAEGAKLLVGSPNKAYIERVFSASHSVNPDELQKHPQTATVIEVQDQMSLKDQVEEIRLYKVANPHAEGMLIGYVVGADLIWVTDLWVPGFDKTRNPRVVSLSEAIKNLGITPQRYAGGHGGVGTNSELESIVARN
jgi:Metallo-beta-lactamase superfamily